jgi:hypothetical protein
MFGLFESPASVSVRAAMRQISPLFISLWKICRATGYFRKYNKKIVESQRNVGDDDMGMKVAKE